MKSTVVKRSIVLAGHKTSVSLEDAFWEGLKDIAKTKRKTLSELVGGIDIDREHANLSVGHTAVCAQSLSSANGIEPVE
jgi:predicted DNA-binding ribbon-helix-helix protein